MEKRISGIGTHELIIWAENALFTIGKNVTNRRDDYALEEAELGAEALLAIVKELKKRSANGL